MQLDRHTLVRHVLQCGNDIVWCPQEEGFDYDLIFISGAMHIPFDWDVVRSACTVCINEACSEIVFHTLRSVFGSLQPNN